MKIFTFLTAFVGVAAACQIASAHPADGLAPNELPAAYGTESYGYPDGSGFADVTFHGNFPNPNSLSDAEKYIIAGAGSSNEFLMPWSSSIFSFVDMYEKQHGHVPVVIDEAAILSCFPNSNVDSSYIETLRSPLTGQFPRTDQVSFSSGDIYCRKLTASEINEAAQYDAELRTLVDAGQFFNPFTMQMENAELATGVFYIRIYGQNDVVYESVQYEVYSLN